MSPAYYVKAIWDPEARVWISETNVVGLVIEANTLSEFESLVVELVPEMLEANGQPREHGAQVIFTAHRELALA